MIPKNSVVSFQSSDKIILYFQMTLLISQIGLIRYIHNIECTMGRQKPIANDRAVEKRPSSYESNRANQSPNNRTQSLSPESWPDDCGCFNLPGGISFNRSSLPMYSKQRHNNHQNYSHNGSISSRWFDKQPLVRKSKDLRTKLLRSLRHTLVLVEQWNAEDCLGDDEMDWEPENEVVIPQSQDLWYDYGCGAWDRRCVYKRDEGFSSSDDTGSAAPVKARKLAQPEK